MGRLILGAALLTALPLLALQHLRLPALPDPVAIFGSTGGMILLESVRLAARQPASGRNA